MGWKCQSQCKHKSDLKFRGKYSDNIGRRVTQPHFSTYAAEKSEELQKRGGTSVMPTYRSQGLPPQPKIPQNRGPPTSFGRISHPRTAIGSPGT
jgi:hypothetical protein